MNDLPEKIRKSFLIWAASITTFIGVLFIGTSGFKEEVLDYDKVFGIPQILEATIIGAVLIGIVSFLVFVISSIKFFTKKQNLSKKKLVIKLLRIGLILGLLPLFLAAEVLKPLEVLKQVKAKGIKSIEKRSFLKDLGFTIILILLLIPVWSSAYFIFAYIPASMAGLISEPISIGGTGSMYPTFPKGHGKDPKELGKQLVAIAGMLPYPNGITLFGHKVLGNEIGRGDIVVVENEKIRQSTKKQYGEPSGLVKRVIALPGDIISIKDGLVFLNGKVLKEPYIARARSTFGGEFLRDCNELKIPEGKLFIMGDNRKGSGDSRHDVGFIDYKDVHHVLPYKDQLGNLDKGWHDPKNDDKESLRISLDKNKYLDLVNQERTKTGLRPLKYEGRLELSAQKRGEVMLRFDDLSFEATRSGYTMSRAIADSGYSNIVYSELPSLGSYEAEELSEYYFEFPETKEFLLDKDYQDIGISTVKGELNGCPTNIVVLHIAGYVPPNYKAEDIQGWGTVVDSLNKVIPGWEAARSYKNINQDDLNKIIGLMYQRKNNAEAIYYRMKNNQWFTAQEKQYVDQDKSLYDQINTLADKLNGR